MHWKTKESAINTYGPIYKEKGEEAALEAMLSDERLTVEDRAELIEEFTKGANESGGTPSTQGPPPVLSPEALAEIKAQAKAEALAELQAQNSLSPSPSVAPAPVVSSYPNEAIAEKLAAINYENLVGEEFNKYLALVKSLPLEAQFDFELKKAKPVRKARYEGIEGSPVDLIGIEITNIKAEFTTRIPVRVALDANAQIENAHSVAGHGKYYFLKK